MKNKIKVYAIVNGIFLGLKLLFNYFFMNSDSLKFGLTETDILYFVPAAFVLITFLLADYVGDKINRTK